MTITINNHTFTYGPSAWGGTYFSDGQNVNISTKENPTPEGPGSSSKPTGDGCSKESERLPSTGSSATRSDGTL